MIFSYRSISYWINYPTANERYLFTRWLPPLLSVSLLTGPSREYDLFDEALNLELLKRFSIVTAQLFSSGSTIIEFTKFVTSSSDAASGTAASKAIMLPLDSPLSQSVSAFWLFSSGLRSKRQTT